MKQSFLYFHTQGPHTFNSPGLPSLAGFDTRLDLGLRRHPPPLSPSFCSQQIHHWFELHTHKYAPHSLSLSLPLCAGGDSTQIHVHLRPTALACWPATHGKGSELKSRVILSRVGFQIRCDIFWSAPEFSPKRSSVTWSDVALFQGIPATLV